MVTSSAGILTRVDIQKYMNRPRKDCLFISPILEKDQIGETSIDLRLGHHFIIPDIARIGMHNAFAQTSEDGLALSESYRSVFVHYGEDFNLHPGQSVLVGTLEYVGVPLDLSGYVTGRSSISRMPILISTATIHPGFRGVITLALTSMAANSITLRPGLRVAQMQLHRLAGAVRSKTLSRYDMTTGPAPAQLDGDKDLRFLTPAIEPIIIGVASTLGAGRTTALDYLRENRGFKSFSLADIVKQEAVRSGVPTTRSKLQEIGNNLRATRGCSYLAERLRSTWAWQTNKSPYVVVDGFKHPKEVLEFRKQRRFHLIAIGAPVEVRWMRTMKLRRLGDPTTYDEFLKLDAMDRGLRTRPESGLCVDEVFKMADTVITNDGSTEDFYRQIEGVVQAVLYPH
jgi:dCTP deaminase